MSKLVWIIDDDPGILEVTEIVLHEAGFDVVKIDNEKSLEKNFSGKVPQVILLDNFMSGIQGKDIVKMIKTCVSTKYVPIIMMSADVHLEEKAKEANATDFLKKPYDIQDLEDIVKKYSA